MYNCQMHSFFLFQEHLDDKHLSRFLEADTPIIQDESQNKVNAASH